MMPRKHEFTSRQIAGIAAQGIKAPGSLTQKEVRAVCASALTQAEDRKAAKVAASPFVTAPEGWTRWAIENAAGGLEKVYDTRGQAREEQGITDRVIPVQVIRRRRNTAR